MYKKIRGVYVEMYKKITTVNDYIDFHVFFCFININYFLVFYILQALY